MAFCGVRVEDQHNNNVGIASGLCMGFVGIFSIYGTLTFASSRASLACGVVMIGFVERFMLPLTLIHK